MRDMTETTRIFGYESPKTIGHKMIEGIFDDEPTLVIQEKIDGSQFSFGVDKHGTVRARSRGQQIDLDAPDKLFQKAVDTIMELRTVLKFGWTYRGEYLKKPKHNSLAYDRTPFKNIIIFDIDRGLHDYLGPDEMKIEADRIGLECVPTWSYSGKPNMDTLNKWLDLDSVLGGVKIEGVVIKNYQKFGPDGKVLMAKYVSENFKEVHSKDWKIRHPSGKDYVQGIIDDLATEARWMKAVQHLREAGEIENVPQDIPILMKEISRDVYEECGEEIKEKLFKHYWKQINKGLTKGMPEWYKALLAQEALNEDSDI